MKMWKREIIFFAAVLAGFIFMIAGMCIVGNKPETYTALIDGLLSQYMTNKSGELSLFWKLLFSGSIIIGIGNAIIKIGTSVENKPLSNIKRDNIVVLGSAILAFLMALIVNGKIPAILAVCISIFLVCIVTIPQDAVFELAFFIVSIYGLIGSSYVINYLGQFELNTKKALIAALIVTILSYIVSKIYVTVQKRLFLLLQMGMPFVLLQYFVSEYVGTTQTVEMPLEKLRVVFITALIIVLEIIIIAMIVKNWKDVRNKKWEEMVSCASCISIAIFTFNSGAAKILTGDLHHSGEYIIAYQQIIEKGQHAYANYSPASGLYAVFIGFINQLLGGNMTSVWMANAMVAILTVIIEVTLLCRLIGNKRALYIVVAISMVGIQSDYSRANWILLSILLLIQPDLRKNRDGWLRAWVLLSLFSGMFYPLFGVAICLGAAPYGIIQFINYIRSGELKESVKKPLFYVRWIVVIMIVGIFVPTLFRMAQHVLTYASQSIMSDGIAVFGQEVPDGFLPYLSDSHVNIRKALYYSIRYVLPAVFEWVLLALFITLWKKNKTKGTKFWETESFFMLSYGLIVLPISYTFTLVRADRNYILCRTGYVAVPFIVTILFIIALKDVETIRIKCEIIGFCMGLPLILGFGNLNNLDEHFNYSYTIPDGCVQITEEEKEKYPKLGDGFIEPWMLDRINTYSEITSEILTYAPDTSFYGLNYVEYYVLDVKACGQTSISEGQSMAAVKKNIEVMKQEQPVIFIPQGVSNCYYLYYWLMENDDYQYVPKYSGFLTKTLIEKIPGIEIGTKMNFVTSGVDFLGTPSSFGNSYDSLIDNVLAETGIQVEMSSSERQELLADNGNTRAEVFRFSLKKEINGKDADYIYLDFNVDNNMEGEEQTIYGEKLSLDTRNQGVRVTVYFSDGNEVSCDIGNGKLLIPVGANNRWLLNDIGFFSVRITGLSDNADITFNEVKLLKSDAEKVFEE